VPGLTVQSAVRQVPALCTVSGTILRPVV